MKKIEYLWKNIMDYRLTIITFLSFVTLLWLVYPNIKPYMVPLGVFGVFIANLSDYRFKINKL